MSKAQTRASNKYSAKTYERIALFVKKGERDKIKGYAAAKGYSLNAYINALIAADMQADNGLPATEAAEPADN